MRRFVIVSMLPLGLFFTPLQAQAENAPPASLKTVRVPTPDNLRDYVRDKRAAIVLGKALFWDQQVGSNGTTACGTCHFSAGADLRTRGQFHPGTDAFELGGLEHDLSLEDFPFHRLADAEDRDSEVLFDSDDVLGSAGVVSSAFTGIVVGGSEDEGTIIFDPIFQVGGTAVSQATRRNAPSMINAIFNVEQFWDGRADRVFNGVNGRGISDNHARILTLDANGNPVKTRVRLDKASLASQAVGPPLNTVEMSFAGRTFPLVGRKLLNLRPLGLQEVHSEDGVLGAYRHPSGQGLRVSYADLIKKAFHKRLWDSNRIFESDLDVIGKGTPSGPDQYSMMEANFSLFFGLAIQMYESTLVSDDTPYDRFQEGDETAMTEEQQEGLEVFMGAGRCINCHGGPNFSNAAFGFADSRAYTNTGVREPSEDLGQKHGRFKTPGLRNVELTGPYFHNGSQATLRQVMSFYDRGGDFPNEHTSSHILPLEFDDEQEDALVSFLLALTDERVRHQRAPFDHPSIAVPNGPLVPAVGRFGGEPLTTFLNLSPFDGSDEGEEAKVTRRPGAGGDGGAIAGSLPVATLGANYPNPFNPTTQIQYSLPSQMPVRIVIHDAQGRTVRTLVDASQPSGEHRATWNGTNDSGVPVAGGVYFVRLQAGASQQTRKLTLIK